MPPKRRRRFQGLYYHSSPPKVLPMNDQIANSNGRTKRAADDLSVKLSTIRIWMHEKDIGKLTRVLWAGQGNRLRQQASTNAKVKKFLAAVPYVMNSIKDVHQAVIDNSLENLQSNLEPPVPPALVTCRDANGLNLIHKAAGLGHATILEYLITTWPDGVHETDITGKTPLHWAASAKNNMRCYTLLTQAGCNEEAVDYKMKTPSFYRHKPHEIERAFLTYVPEAPRVSPDISTDWDSLSVESGDGKKLGIKIPEMNGFGRHSIAESNENTSEAEMTEAASGHEEDKAANEEQPEEETANEEVESQDEEQQPDEAKEEIINQEEGEEVETADAKENNDDQDEETKEEFQDEKQQTQSHTETTANLAKEEDDRKDNENNKSKEHKTEDTDEKDNSGDGDHATEVEIKNEETALEEKEKAGHDTDSSDGTTCEKDKHANNSDTHAEKTIVQENDKNIKETLEENTKDEKIKETIDQTMSVIKENGEKNEDILDNKSDEKDTDGKTETDEENEPVSELKTGQENDDASQEIKKVEKENDDKVSIKTIGDTLVDIKDEVKDNVKYLANQIKNVFSDKEDKGDQGKEDKLSNSDANIEDKLENEENEKEIETETETVSTINDQSEDDVNNKQENTNKLIESKENDSPNKVEGKENENQEISQKQNENELETKTEDEVTKSQGNEISKENSENQASDRADDSKDEDFADSNENVQRLNTPAISSQNNNNSNKNMPSKIQTPPSTARKTPSNESPKNENDKTDEDENNNSSKLAVNEIETTKTKTNATEAITDEQFKELDKSLKEYKKAEENTLEEKEKDVGDKLEEIAGNFKQNVKEIADNVTNIFSPTTTDTKDESEKLDNESNDVVVHTERPQRQASAKKSVKDGESSDDTADEDEDPQAEAENEENNETDGVVVNDNENAAEPEQDSLTERESQTNANEVDTKETNVEKLDDEERNDEGSPSSPLDIEGYVQGDAEDNTVQSQTAAYVHADEETRIQSIIASGDMEQLADIVLNGDGQKLLNVEATEPEIQAFLKNVPNYMSKIRRVHEAARNGSLLNLQQALDRRKFAIAKDEISPEGATPLHVAVLFGNSDIVRYLSARFPETMTITDNNGRTALHYAAVINDNGHFYNILLQLGANPKVVDQMGRTPEDYLSKEELNDSLNYGELLKRFGAAGFEEHLLSDQGQIENQSVQENPIFKTEQGKYLADNLADPLIKALTQVAQKRPNDPLEYLTNYLQSFVRSRNKNGRTVTQAAVHPDSSQTNSTVSASSRQLTPGTIMQREINAYVSCYDKADRIEEEAMKKIDGLDYDDGNDSDAAMPKKLSERDEHGQSMLHFACARSHRKGGVLHLIEDAKADITYRDELYRTARDVALQANQLGNAKEIDYYVISLAIVGDIKPFEHFALSGYDHIIDVLDNNETPIIQVAEDRGLYELSAYLKTIRPLEELREELHQMVRDNNVDRVKEIADGPDGRWLIKAKNYYGRNALHIAILKESVEIVEHFVSLCPEALKVGDNLERTALHYAMGTSIIESVRSALIQNGAKRTYKDLKGRQPSYYFMNKADILRLQEEEDESR